MGGVPRVLAIGEEATTTALLWRRPPTNRQKERPPRGVDDMGWSRGVVLRGRRGMRWGRVRGKREGREGSRGRAEKGRYPCFLLSCLSKHTTLLRLFKPLLSEYIPLWENLLTCRVQQRLNSCYDSQAVRLAWARQPINNTCSFRLSSPSECGCERRILSSDTPAGQPTDCGFDRCGGRPLKTANVIDLAV